MNHLCTTNSFLAGALTIQTKCLVCRKDTLHQVGYVVQKCTDCGAEYDDDLGRTVRLRREYMGLSRAQIAKIYGVQEATIASYERWPCEKYWNWILNLQCW